MRLPSAATAGATLTALVAVLGAAAVAGGLGYGAFLEEGRIGPGFLPLVAGGTVVVCAGIDLIARLRKRRQPVHSTVGAAVADETAAEDAASRDVPVADGEAPAPLDSDLDIFGRTQQQRNRMLVAVIALTVAALVLVPFLGFVISFGLLLIACAVLVERRKLLPSILVTVVALAVAYVIFAIVLRVPLPVSPLGF